MEGDTVTSTSKADDYVWEQMPVHVARGLSPEQVCAYRLADNATRGLSEWNYELLPDVVEALQAILDQENEETGQ